MSPVGDSCFISSSIIPATTWSCAVIVGRPCNGHLTENNSFTLTAALKGGHHCISPPFFLVFLGPHLRHMDVPRLWVESELQLPAYTTATAARDLSHICDLHHGSRQHWILSPLSKTRDQTCILMDTRQVGNRWATTRTSKLLLFKYYFKRWCLPYCKNFSFSNLWQLQKGLLLPQQLLTILQRFCTFSTTVLWNILWNAFTDISDNSFQTQGYRQCRMSKSGAGCQECTV